MDVPRRQCQPVRLADRRAGDDLGRDGEVARHLADDHDLLGVLLPEVGPLGADQVEEDRDDRGDAVEVSGPCGAFERPGDGSDRHGRVEAGRIDLVDLRREDEIDAFLSTDREIARLVPRISLEVRGLVELARVDEDRRDRRRAVGAGPTNQRTMPIVEPAHRGDEAQWPWGGAECLA